MTFFRERARLRVILFMMFAPVLGNIIWLSSRNCFVSPLRQKKGDYAKKKRNYPTKKQAVFYTVSVMQQFVRVSSREPREELLGLRERRRGLRPGAIVTDGLSVLSAVAPRRAKVTEAVHVLRRHAEPRRRRSAVL
jgi:hypothetical protein